MTTPAEIVAPPRDLRGRGLWTRLALAPGAVLHVWLLLPQHLVTLGVVVGAGIATACVGILLRGRGVRFGYADSGPIIDLIVLALLLPAAVSPWLAAFAAVVAIGVARQSYGGTGHYLFQPAMVGLASAMVLTQAPAANAPFRSQPELIVAAAYLAGGLLLMALRIVRWQAPAAMLAALALLALPGLLLTRGPLEIVVLPLFSAATLLVAFFVVGDAVPGAATARGRLVYGAGIAALAALLWRGGRLDAAFPAAVLLMNVAAPALDRWLAPMPPAPTP